MKITFITSLSIVLSTLGGCHEELGLPTVVSGEIDSVSNNTAVSNGIILNTGGAKIVIHGICWDTTANPTFDLMTKTTSFDEEREFKHKLTGLIKNTTYYVRAYVKTSSGSNYGDVVVFTSYNSTEASGDILALPSDVLLENGVEVEFLRNDSYFGHPRIRWSPINDPISWKVSFSGVKPGATPRFARVAGVEIYFPDSIPPSESRVYQLKPNNTDLNANEASLSYYYADVTNEPNTNPSSYQGWSTNGALEVNVIRGEVNISFSNVAIDSNIVISGNLKLR